MLLLILLGSASLGSAQKGYNLYFSMSPTVTFGTQFENGSNQVVSPDNKTGVNTIYPLYSVLDGWPDVERSFMQSLARKFSYGLILEAYLSERHSFNLGMEFGSRGYKVISASSISSLISYRNWCFPVYFSRYKWLGTFWTLKFNYGGSINYAYSQVKSNKVVDIQSSPTLYPLLGGGVEMAYMGKDGKLSFELAYYHGWQNILNHTYIGVDNKLGEGITSNASTLRLVMKYNFQRLSGPRKRKEKSHSLVAIDPVQFWVDRIQKEPQQLEVDSDSLEFCFLDDQTVDGDSILLMWNDSIVGAPIGLDKTPACIKLGLKPGNNRLVVHAINEGKIKPNTYEIRVKDGAAAHQIRMKSDMQNSAVLEVRRKRY
ncbi:MAG: hypothetical protein EP332_05120 [Bacteroidetes bacterium]|nr:MAG: hypothetical protein EP332_05120 [Bacteroidota bacterium]